MKKLVLVLTLLLPVLCASGQHRHENHRQFESREHSGHDKHHQDRHGRHDRHDRHHRGESHRDSHRDYHFQSFDHDRHFDNGHNRQPGHGHHRADIACIRDWQELWNGCHVRIDQFGVSILSRQGDRILRGDEVILFSSGLYKVRSGDFWRVYTAYGQRLGNVWGDSVEHMQNGLIRCVRAGNVHYYDIDGNEHR